MNENICANCIPAWVHASYQVWVCQSSINPQSFTDGKVIRYPSVSLVRLSVHRVEMLNAEFEWKTSDISVGICWSYFDSILVLSIIFIYAESWKLAKPNMQSVRLAIPSFQGARWQVGLCLDCPWTFLVALLAEVQFRAI